MLESFKAKRPGSSLGKILFYEAARTALGIFFSAVYRVRVFHIRRVPASGPLLLVANHQSYFDPPLIGFGIGQRHIDYLARVGLFKVPGLTWLISALNATPIKEDSGDSAAIKEVLRRLAEGHAVLIFPEGSRSGDGRIDEFKRGVALLFRRAGCPVIPVAIEGGFEAWPRDRKFPGLWGKRVAVMFGEPIQPTELNEAGPDGALRLLRQRIDVMRLELRCFLRRSSHGRYPPPGPADHPAEAERTPARPAPMPRSAP